MGRALCRFGLDVASIGWWESDVVETDVVFRVEQSGWSWLSQASGRHCYLSHYRPRDYN